MTIIGTASRRKDSGGTSPAERRRVTWTTTERSFGIRKPPRGSRTRTSADTFTLAGVKRSTDRPSRSAIVRHAGLFVLATSVVWTMLACRGFDHRSAQGGSLQVELDAFSGQPNPRWELTADESAEFLAQFQKLNRASSSGTA